MELLEVDDGGYVMAAIAMEAALALEHRHQPRHVGHIIRFRFVTVHDLALAYVALSGVSWSPLPCSS